MGFSQYILVQSHRTIVSRTDILIEEVATGTGTFSTSGHYSWTDSVVGSGEPCPWTSPFASLFTTLQNMPWSHSVHATNNDVIRVYVDYRHDTGWEQWRTEGSRPVIYPNPGGPLPEPPDGHFRRVRDTREVLSIRVVVYPK